MSLLLACAIIYLVRGVLGAFVLGAVLAFLILPAVDWLEARRVPRAISVLLILAVLVAAFVGVLSLFLPILTTEVGQFRQQVPSMVATVQDQINHLQGHPIRALGFTLNLKDLVTALEGHLNEVLLGGFGNALGIGLAALGTLLQVALLFLVAFLLAVQGHPITTVARRIVPNQYRRDFDAMWRQVKGMFHAYLRGQLLIAALIGVASAITVALLGVPYALTLGVFAGLTALIPYLGPFLGAIPAILVALSIGPAKAAAVAAAYLIISNVILNGVYPKVVGKAVKLPALLVIVAFIAGFSLAGILGMFVAVPVAATLRILFDYLHPRIYGTLEGEPSS